MLTKIPALTFTTLHWLVALATVDSVADFGVPFHGCAELFKNAECQPQENLETTDTVAVCAQKHCTKFCTQHKKLCMQACTPYKNTVQNSEEKKKLDQSL